MDCQPHRLLPINVFGKKEAGNGKTGGARGKQSKIYPFSQTGDIWGDRAHHFWEILGLFGWWVVKKGEKTTGVEGEVKRKGAP